MRMEHSHSLAQASLSPECFCPVQRNCSTEEQQYGLRVVCVDICLLGNKLLLVRKTPCKGIFLFPFILQERQTSPSGRMLHCVPQGFIPSIPRCLRVSKLKGTICELSVYSPHFGNGRLFNTADTVWKVFNLIPQWTAGRGQDVPS